MVDAHFHYEVEDFNQECIATLTEFLDKKDIDKCLLHILDEDWEEKQIHNLVWGTRIIPSFILNPCENDWKEKIEVISKRGFHFVKLLPYEQKILRSDFDKVLTAARELEKRNICLVICGAYGSELLYETNGVELAAYLLKNRISSQIIIAHGGMVKVLDAFSLMDAYQNVSIDLSYAIPFWYGSSLIKDYAFVIQKLKGERIFYGSDYPYVALEESIQAFEKMCTEYNISEEIKEKILNQNFDNFLKNNGWC